MTSENWQQQQIKLILSKPAIIHAEIKIMEARVSFWAFRNYLDPRLISGWWQIQAAEELQQFAMDLLAGRCPMLTLIAPPQHGKSVMIIDFLAWMCGLAPNLRTIFASFSERLGTRCNLRLQRIFESEAYQAVFPDLRIPKKGKKDGLYKCNSTLIEFPGYDGSFRNTTVNGSVTGETCDLGVIDDPVKGNEAANSEIIRNKTWDWYTDDFFTRFSETGGLLMILTRWHDDDLAGRLKKKETKT